MHFRTFRPSLLAVSWERKLAPLLSDLQPGWGEIMIPLGDGLSAHSVLPVCLSVWNRTRFPHSFSVKKKPFTTLAILTRVVQTYARVQRRSRFHTKHLDSEKCKFWHCREQQEPAFSRIQNSDCVAAGELVDEGTRETEWRPLPDWTFTKLPLHILNHIYKQR